MDKRTSKRRVINKDIKTNNSEKCIDESIIDISKNGCKLNSNLVYNIGDDLLIYLDGRLVIGTVVRRNHKGVGIKFREVIL